MTLSLLLTSCGLRAVYSNKYTELKANNPLNAIDIEPIGSIDGTEFYHHLSTLLPRTTTAQYLLKVQFSNVSVPSAFQKNSDVMREITNQSIQYWLFDLKTNKELTSGKFKQMTSYSTMFSPYAAYVENEGALEDLTKHSAEEVRSRLILYFENNKKHEVLPITN